MSEYPQNIAPSGEVNVQDTPEEVAESTTITEQEVGEYREQDRFLPVRILIFGVDDIG